MKVTIHQPEHLIWLGLIDKISKADIFVMLDNVQFTKNNFQNRNRIKTANSWTWLTVPVSKHHLCTKILDIKISSYKDWTQHYLALIKENYKNSKYFHEYYPRIEDIVFKRYPFLVDLNIELIREVLNWFGVKTKIIRSSELKLSLLNKESKRILEICKTLAADTYLSGRIGNNYLELPEFHTAGVTVIFQKFYHPIYKQLRGDFIPGMSCIDLLFNHGPEARDILWGENILRIDCPHMGV